MGRGAFQNSLLGLQLRLSLQLGRRRNKQEKGTWSWELASWKRVAGARARSRPTLCDPVDCSPPGSFVRGILQAGRLEWVPLPPPGKLCNTGIKLSSLASPALAGGLFTTAPPAKPKRVEWV